jgi:hypothetical protein
VKGSSRGPVQGTVPEFVWRDLKFQIEDIINAKREWLDCYEQITLGRLMILKIRLHVVHPKTQTTYLTLSG